MSLTNNTTLHFTTDFIENSDDTTIEELDISLIEHGGIAYVEVNKSGVFLSEDTLEHLQLMLELHQRRINTV